MYICKRWYQKWRTVNNPGPIDHGIYLCPHAQLKPGVTTRNFKRLPISIASLLLSRYGGGPEIQMADPCKICTYEWMAREKERRMGRGGGGGGGGATSASRYAASFGNSNSSSSKREGGASRVLYEKK